VLLPVLLLLLFGGFEGGRYLFLAGALNHAVSGAARRAEIDPAGAGSPVAVAAAIGRMMGELAAPIAVPVSAVEVEDAPCGLDIHVALRYPPLLPLTPELTLASSSCAAMS
jgi:hypothetical protein